MGKVLKLEKSSIKKYKYFYRVYYKKIATHSNFKVNRLETETNTQISIPAGNNGNLVITGGDITKVIQARHRIHSVIDNIRHSYPAMQFVAIPLISEEIKKNFENFKVSNRLVLP